MCYTHSYMPAIENFRLNYGSSIQDTYIEHKYTNMVKHVYM